MIKFLLYIFSIFGFVFADATLKIENFVENGNNTVTFDLMIMSDQDVGGLQFEILSGLGVYDSPDYCICTFTNNNGIVNGIVPEGCDECYFDHGLDFVVNQYEDGYHYNNPTTNGCSEEGSCADPSFSSESSCEEAGLCNGNGWASNDYFCYINGVIELAFVDQESCEVAGLDSNGNVCDGSAPDCTALGNWEAYSSSDCTDSGSCSNGNYTNECDCLQNGSTWTSDDYVWSPTSLWTSYDLPYLCDENGYDWYYANQDASGDDYRKLINPNDCFDAGFQNINCGAFPDDPCCSTNFQFCRMPGINSFTPANQTPYQWYFNINSYGASGHCSQKESYCRDTGLSTCYEFDNYWSGDCDNGFPQGCCNNSVNPDWSWQSPYRDYAACIENGFTWTAYDTQQDCEAWGGVWVGSETGTQGNDMYDVGENFIDTDRNLSITNVYNLPGGFMASENNDEIIMFSLSGGVISSGSEYTRVATITADVTGDAGDIVTLGSKNICKDNYQLQCVSEMIVSDGSGDRMDVSFIPTVWEIGSGANSVGSIEASYDGICSAYAGETIATDSSCPVVCGDNVCSPSENYINCKMDCPDAVDGDGYCNLYEGENAGTSSDCVAFGCGDYYCDSSSEDISNCSFDCLSYCGDGYCDIQGGENEINCSLDGCINQEECNSAQTGDVNLDGISNILDVLQIVNFAMYTLEPTSVQECIADINEDSFINILDILVLVNLIINS